MDYVLKAFYSVRHPLYTVVAPAKTVPVPGLYSSIFVMYLQTYQKDGDRRMKNILFYSLCILYGFSLAIFALDISKAVNADVSDNAVHDIFFFLDFILNSCADRQS